MTTGTVSTTILTTTTGTTTTITRSRPDLAIGAAAAVVGSIVNQPPANCVPVAVNGITYQQCGSTWYQPQYAGEAVQYVVVAPP